MHLTDNPPAVIDRFDGPYDYLSNFYNAPVTYEGITYLNNEAAFQAQKDPARRQEFTRLPPNKAKRLGRNVNLRTDWDDVRVGIMDGICKAKFEQHPALKDKLIMTGDARIIEGNYWHDQIWGSCTCLKHKNIAGQNELGKILMRLRHLFSQSDA